MRLGTSTTTCNAAATGGLRWSSSDRTIEMCDGSTGWRKIVGNLTTAAPSAPDPNRGFFVLTAARYSSNIGNLTGANATCLTDLTNNDWNGKAEAVSRGLLNSTKVRAWLCNGSSCQNLQADVNYQFAVSGSTTKGGATIRTSDGVTHNNTQNWSGHNYWGVANYFTGRSVGSDTVFGDPVYSPCRNWTYAGTNGGDVAPQGDSNNTTRHRWYQTQYGTCNQTLKLVCMVHP